MIRRYLAERVLEALADTPVVMLQGARQTGKSTLAEWVAGGPHQARYVTLDDPATLAGVNEDPAGFLAAMTGNLVIDEVQRAPGLFLALKAAVDRERTPGRFLLTGSSHVLTAPRVADSLAGRMEALTLWPLSQGEIAGKRDSFLSVLLGSGKPSWGSSRDGAAEVWNRMLVGGYPEPAGRTTPERRRAWHAAYITTILQRDVRDLAAVEGLTAFPRLLAVLASRAAQPLGASDVSRELGMPYTTLRRYLALLEAIFLVHIVPAWASNQGQKFVKAPKLVLADTGSMAYLTGASPDRLREDATLRGRMLENFVIMELIKQAGWQKEPPTLFHFRTQTGDEVDAVIEDAQGRVSGVEVKATASPGAPDFKGLHRLKAAAGKRFRRGVLLYTGRETVAFGDGLFAAPVSSLWS
ncbi:MAG: ATP-binding protein [Candidatus Coatesbacteria bacterium]